MRRWLEGQHKLALKGIAGFTTLRTVKLRYVRLRHHYLISKATYAVTSMQPLASTLGWPPPPPQVSRSGARSRTPPPTPLLSPIRHQGGGAPVSSAREAASQLLHHGIKPFRCHSFPPALISSYLASINPFRCYCCIITFFPGFSHLMRDHVHHVSGCMGGRQE